MFRPWMERGVVCHEETEQGLTAQGHAVVCAWEQVLTGSSGAEADAVWVVEAAEVPAEVLAGELHQAMEWVTAEDMP